jgi:processing peptidase subunit beta
LGKLGAWLCTTVDRDHTAYYVNCLSSDVEKAVEILADVLKNSKFDEADIEKERNFLLLNLQEADENYAGTMWNFLHSAAFQGTGYENSPLGNTEAIKAMTRDDIFEFAEDQLKPVRMVFTGCGGIEHSRIGELAEKHFGTLNNTYKRKIPIAGSVRFTGSEFRYRNDNIPIMHGAIAVEGVPLSHPDALALKVANEAVGEWDHSQASSENAPNVVTQKVCTNGELLSFENFSINYTKTGLFGFKFSAHGHAVEPLQEGIFPILRQWKHLAVGVTDQEVDRAKTRLKVNLFQNLETNENEAKHFATQVLGTGKVTQLSELWKQIDNIDAGDVREALSRHVYDREIACAGVGRTEAFPNYFILRNAMSWWRL